MQSRQSAGDKGSRFHVPLGKFFEPLSADLEGPEDPNTGLEERLPLEGDVCLVAYAMLLA